MCFKSYIVFVFFPFFLTSVFYLLFSNVWKKEKITSEKNYCLIHSQFRVACADCRGIGNVNSVGEGQKRERKEKNSWWDSNPQSLV